MSSESRTRVLLLLLLSLVLTGAIAAGLSGLAFKPGLPLPSFEKGEVAVAESKKAPVGMSMGSFASILVLIVLGISFLVLVIRAARGIPWKKLLAGLGSLLWKLAIVAGIVLLVVSLLPHSEATAPAEPLPPPQPLATAPLGPVPPGLIWAAAIGLGSIVVFIVFRALAANRRTEPGSWVEEVAHARQALLDGGDLREVIIRCYTRMSEELQEERGIERESSMTTGEFESLLADKGLPREPVRELTRLFEIARYSPHAPAPGEGTRAIACLDAILDWSRSAPGGEAA